MCNVYAEKGCIIKCSGLALHDWYIVIDSSPVLLGHTLSDPNDVSILLLLKLEKRVEHTEAELPHERVQVHLDLLLEKAVLYCLVAWIRAHVLEQGSVLAVVLRHHLHLVVLLGLGQLIQAVRVELAAARVQLGALVRGQLDAERVDCDHECASVRFELQINKKRDI